MCNSEFVESKGAIRHLRTVHQVSDEEIDKAKVLHQQVTAERIANNPPKETVVKKPVFNVYQCDTCKKSFTTAKYLYEHKTVKHGTAPFPCTYKGCKKGFISFNLLEKHVRQVRVACIYLQLFINSLIFIINLNLCEYAILKINK